MRSKEFRSLVEAANSVVGPKKAVSSQLNEEAQLKNLYEGCSQDEIELVESIAHVLESVETQLGIHLDESEVEEATNFILETTGTNMIIEQIQNDVGFELNEEEINYVMNQLRG